MGLASRQQSAVVTGGALDTGALDRGPVARDRRRGEQIVMQGVRSGESPKGPATEAPADDRRDEAC